MTTTNVNNVPKFLAVIDQFYSRDEVLNLDGILRRESGDAGEVQMVKQSLSKRIPSIPEGISPHSVTSVLKSWLQNNSGGIVFEGPLLQYKAAIEAGLSEEGIQNLTDDRIKELVRTDDEIS